MIDTIKLNVYKHVNKSFYNLCCYNSDNRLQGYIINNKTGTATKQFLWSYKKLEYDTFDMEIIKGKFTNSYNYHIHFRIFEDRIEFEFSIPKLIFGTNVLEAKGQLQKHTPYDILILGIKFFFKKLTPNCIINYSGVVLKRFDFCYNQIFDNSETCLNALKYIKLKYASKNDKLNFEYGHVELTKSKYFKIYYKGAEFEKHDRIKLLKHKNLPQFIDLSNKTLRYEKKYTPKNWSYFYNVHYKHQNQIQLKKDYYLAKKNGKVTKSMRFDFESLVNFTIGNSQVNKCTKLPPFLFNHFYTLFRQDIAKRYNIGNKSTTTLKKMVIEGHKNKTQLVRILSFIKVFKSLKRAQENGAFSLKTLYRYEKIMRENNLSSNVQPITIKQDWSHQNYNKYISLNIPFQKLSKGIIY